MKDCRFSFYVLLLVFLAMGCEINDGDDESFEGIPEREIPNIISSEPIPKNEKINILSLGDSYTIGQGVCDVCSYPEQLKEKITKELGVPSTLKNISRTGWTTTDLLFKLEQENINQTYDFVTLLIGVNNQFQGIDIEIFKEEFDVLVAKAISFTGNKKENLVVLSIPDYGFTPFAGYGANISKEIDLYNSFIEAYCKANEITYLWVTDISRRTKENPDLLAKDGLHLSESAYKLFADRIYSLFVQTYATLSI